MCSHPRSTHSPVLSVPGVVAALAKRRLFGRLPGRRPITDAFGRGAVRFSVGQTGGIVVVLVVVGGGVDVGGVVVVVADGTVVFTLLGRLVGGFGRVRTGLS